MLKIDPVVNSIGRYCRKNTVNARYNKNLDMATFSGIGTCIQMFRFSSWGIHDIGISSMLATLTLKCFSDAMRDKKLLLPIKKRAKSIKNANATK